MPQHGGVNGLGASAVELHLSGITSNWLGDFCLCLRELRVRSSPAQVLKFLNPADSMNLRGGAAW